MLNNYRRTLKIWHHC